MTQPLRDTRPSPLSVRLNEAEWQRLRELAGETPLSAYVKGVVFDTRNGDPATSAVMLARCLVLLGKSQLTQNIAFIAEAARSGSVFDNESSVQALDQACEDIRYIRQTLLKALCEAQEVQP